MSTGELSWLNGLLREVMFIGHAWCMATIGKGYLILQRYSSESE